MRKHLSLLCLLLISCLASGQNILTVTGNVTESHTGEPVVGVNIRVKGQNIGTITDLDGNYSLPQVPNNATLVYSLIGMKAVEVGVNGRTRINVELQEDIQMLEETVVIGYGSAKKRDLTGSIATVRAEDIANRPASNPLASIQGKIPGVQIVNGGQAGQDPEIRIRGTNSINGYAPLYVIDGLFSDNINYLNPADIESMEILKDASSLAIFGVRGANGVIIINTKRAKKGETVVNVNTSIGVKKVHDRMAMTNAAQFRELYDEQLANQEADPFDYTNWQGNTDWQDEIFQAGFISNNNISITGSSDKNRFYMGVGYTTEEGSIKTEKFSKVTVNLSSDYNVSDRLRFGFQVNGARMLPADAKGVATAIKAAPISPVHDETSGLLYALPDFQRAQVYNPLIAIEQQGRHTIAQNHRLSGNVYGELDIIRHLTFKATFSLDYAGNQSRSQTPILYVYNPDIDGEDKKYNLNDRESVNQSKNTRSTAQSDYVLTYVNSFGKHNLTATAGLTTNFIEYSSLGGGRSQKMGTGVSIADDPDKWWLTIIGDESSATNSGSQYKRFTMSYLMRDLYNYDNRYLFNASYRRDGSSVFKRTGNTWQNFYSFGAGWVLSEEEFMKSQSVIDYLKLKGSWGILGNQSTGGYDYPAYPTVVSSGSAVFGDNIIEGKGLKYLASPDLGWEKIYSWEIGMEMNMLGQRLRIEPVYYSKNTKDLLTSVPGIAGATPGLANIGEIRNRGWELSASWSDRIGKNWRYSIGANLTTIDNKVLALVNNDYSIINGASRVTEGYPIGYFYGYVVEGVYQTQEEIDASPENKLGTVRPGDLKFKDIDGDNEITDKDRTMIGNPTPDFTYGITLSLGYKNFDLSVDMMGVYGNEIFRNWDNSTYAQFNYMEKRLGRWHGEGSSNWEPILDPTRAINMNNSTYYIEDGSFFRIKNIQLGYTFDQNFLSKVKIKSLRLYANAQNLKTWAKNTGFTPELKGSATKFGVDEGTYPMPAIYTLGINLTF